MVKNCQFRQKGPLFLVEKNIRTFWQRFLLGEICSSKKPKQKTAHSQVLIAFDAETLEVPVIFLDLTATPVVQGEITGSNGNSS